MGNTLQNASTNLHFPLSIGSNKINVSKYRSLLKKSPCKIKDEISFLEMFWETDLVFMDKVACVCSCINSDAYIWERRRKEEKGLKEGMVSFKEGLQELCPC